MKNFRLIASDLDFVPLMLALQRQPSLWKQDLYWRNHPVPVFSEIDSILLRFPTKAPYQFKDETDRQVYLASVDPWECFDQPVYDLLPDAKSLVFGLMSAVRGERLGRVMINRMQPNSHILPHIDTTTGTKYFDRFHIVLQTNKDVEFRAGEERAEMAPGQAWWFENAVEHEVWNRGDCDRIHVVIDIKCKGFEA
jgi:hypothetical protein